jgi:P27 family predicted phage terminase small subunit
MKKVPESLGETGAAWYRKILKTYRLNSHELEVLETAATCLDRIHSAQEKILHDGIIVTDLRGAVKKHPAAEVEISNKKTFLDFCKALKILQDEDSQNAKKK